MQVLNRVRCGCPNSCDTKQFDRDDNYVAPLCLPTYFWLKLTGWVLGALLCRSPDWNLIYTDLQSLERTILCLPTSKDANLSGSGMICWSLGLVYPTKPLIFVFTDVSWTQMSNKGDIPQSVFSVLCYIWRLFLFFDLFIAHFCNTILNTTTLLSLTPNLPTNHQPNQNAHAQYFSHPLPLRSIHRPPNPHHRQRHGNNSIPNNNHCPQIAILR